MEELTPLYRRVASLEGDPSAPHLFVLKHIHAHIDALQRELAEIDAYLSAGDAACRRYGRTRLCSSCTERLGWMPDGRFGATLLAYHSFACVFESHISSIRQPSSTGYAVCRTKPDASLSGPSSTVSIPS